MPEVDAIAIRTDNLTKTYRSGQTAVTVFERLTFDVRRGESVALVGESGAGKSTLLHLLGGLDRPTSGEIYYGARGITQLTDGELSDFRNRAIGFVWQSHGLLPEFSALENVMMPLLIRGVPRAKAAAPAQARLEEVGLGQRLQNLAGELSGGEQQRVSLARALVASPQVLLADEPTGNLDFRTSESIIQLLENLQRMHQLTSVIVTHNMAFARRCDRIVHLEKGQISSPTAESANWPKRESDGNPYV